MDFLAWNVGLAIARSSGVLDRREPQRSEQGLTADKEILALKMASFMYLRRDEISSFRVMRM